MKYVFINWSGRVGKELYTLSDQKGEIVIKKQSYTGRIYEALQRLARNGWTQITLTDLKAKYGEKVLDG